MKEIIKVYDIGDEVKETVVNDDQKKNIMKIFSELSKEKHLITNCYLDDESELGRESPLYYFSKTTNKDKFDYMRIAKDLLKAECKADMSRNSTIREGLLLIKVYNKEITIMKLEKLNVIDKETYEIKSELGKEKDYFKVCIFRDNFKDIKIIDKNKTAAKYWYKKFLKLFRIKTSEDSTNELIALLKSDRLYDKNIVESPNYKEIKRFTESYLFENKKFDKSNLFSELNSGGLIELQKEDELFSEESICLDADFCMSDKAISKNYQRKISISKDMYIYTNNYLESIRDGQIQFDEKNRIITVDVDDDYIDDVKEMLDDN